MSQADHWNHIYETKQSHDVSWFQAAPTTSLQLLDAAGLNIGSCIIDVGGGDSRLVDSLVSRGLHCVTVLDISKAAIARTQTRIGQRAEGVKWIVADVAGSWEAPLVDFWHDRAVFHFLIEQDDRARYIAHLRKALKPGGFAVIATFALDGPTKCSGLPVKRYSEESLSMELGADFDVVRSFVEPHTTPLGTTQSFVFALFRRTV